LPIEHQGWKLEAKYLAYALCSLIVSYSPQRIVLSGDVMQRQEIFPMIHHHVQNILIGYVQAPDILERIDRFIVPPGLGNRSGILGAIALVIES
jgi:fructokinase